MTAKQTHSCRADAKYINLLREVVNHHNVMFEVEKVTVKVIPPPTKPWPLTWHKGYILRCSQKLCWAYFIQPSYLCIAHINVVKVTIILSSMNTGQQNSILLMRARGKVGKKIPARIEAMGPPNMYSWKITLRGIEEAQNSCTANNISPGSQIVVASLAGSLGFFFQTRSMHDPFSVQRWKKLGIGPACDRGYLCPTDTTLSCACICII